MSCVYKLSGAEFEKSGPFGGTLHLKKYAIKLHHGKCRTKNFLELYYGQKSSDISASAPLILSILFLVVSCKAH